MPVVYETRWFRRHWGWKRTNTNNTGSGQYGFMEADWSKIDGVMSELTEELNAEGWEIKSVVPLVSSEYQTTGLTNSTGVFQGAWGGGYGYGATFSEGIVLLCQRATEMTQDDYRTHLQGLADLKAAKDREIARKAALKVAADAIRKEPYETVSKGVFKLSTYRYDGVEYPTEMGAQDAREAKAVAKENE